MLINVRDLDLRLIRVFLAIVDANGISAAQERLGISQSTISTQLATLEVRLGFKLCERGRTGFRLTAKGERFVSSARRLLVSLSEFAVETQHLEKKLIGQLNVGLIGQLSRNDSWRLSQVVARFRKRDEAVRLNFFIHSPDQQEEMLLYGRLHLAIGYFLRRTQNLRYSKLLSEKQVAFCGRGHPLFDSAGKVDVEDAIKHSWVSRGYTPPKAHLQVPQQNIRATANNMEAVAILVMSGEHLGYLPQEVGEVYVQQGLMRALNPSKMHYDVTLHAVVNKVTEHEDEALQAFQQDLKAVFSQQHDEAIF